MEVTEHESTEFAKHEFNSYEFDGYDFIGRRLCMAVLFVALAPVSSTARAAGV